jgi:Tol biopolymer transport system component
MSRELDRQRWDRISALLEETLDLPAGARSGFLDHVCADDPGLRADVEALLAADERADGFLDQPADPQGELLAEALLEHDVETAASADRAGQRLGAFLLVRELGHGGMGAVYLGERADGQFEQKVAIKLIHARLHQRLLRDFLRERQILARLEHPHIARLLDGGITPDGLPYLVMEYVEGEPITSYCERLSLPTDERLRLFLAVCEGVAAAHGAQVVHRDLKPSNILVSTQGDVKLVDFGAARSLELDVELTRTLAPALTPLYAAPEQLLGEPGTVATDVYGLGLLLYELLTGVRAHRIERPDELLRVVLREAPEPPSAAARHLPRRAEAAALRRRLRGDLDGIVLKALDKEPARRYLAATALANDLRRHLAGQPVTARGGGFAYRAAKLLRRRRIEAAFALVLVALAGATAIWQRHPTAPARPRRFELLSTFAGSHRSPSLSPDGRRLAFVQKDGRGTPQIWTKDLARGEPFQVTRGDRPAHRPRWAPEGDRIVFDVPDQGIWSLPASGGAPRRLLREGFNPNLSRDGKRLVYETWDRLWIAASDGSAARPLTGEHFYLAYQSPAMSPDGRQVVFFVSSSGPYGDLWLVPAAGGEAHQLTHDVAEGGDPVWTPDGRWILYSSDRSGAMNLWRVAAGGGAPEPVTEGAGEDAEPELSRDGRLLVYTSTRNVYSLSWLDPRTGERRDLLERRTPPTHPTFSPRGDRVAFFYPQGRQSHLFTVGLHGEDLREVTSDPGGFQFLPEWSADGRFLYFYDLRRLFFGRVPAGGGQTQTLIPGWRFEKQHGSQVDPAKTRVAYTLLQGVRATATLLRDLATGRETPLAQPLAWPRWSPDGRSLAGRAVDGRLLLCPASGAPCRALSPRGAEPRWTRDGREIYFTRYSGQLASLHETAGIWSVAPDGSGERHVAELPGYHYIHSFYTASNTGEIVWCEWRPGRQEMWEAALP